MAARTAAVMKAEEIVGATRAVVALAVVTAAMTAAVMVLMVAAATVEDVANPALA